MIVNHYKAAHLKKYVVDSNKLLWLGNSGPRFWVLHGLQEMEIAIDGHCQLEMCEVVHELLQSVHLDLCLCRTLFLLRQVLCI